MIEKYKEKLAKLTVILFAIIFAELICRLFYDKISIQRRLVVELALTTKFQAYNELEQQPKISPSPYTLYKLTPNYKGEYRTNKFGYRGDEFQIEKNQNKVRILALGGSTTYGASVNDVNKTWPILVQDILKKKGYDKIEVINGGVESAASPEILSSWIYKHRFLNPDIVILNMGINDIWPILLTKNFSEDYSSFRAAQSFYRPPDYVKFLLKHSYLLRTIWINIFSGTDTNINGDPYTQSIDSDLIESELKDQTVTKRAKNINIVFKNNFEYLIKIIQMDEIKIFVVLEQSMNLEQMKNKKSIIVHNIENPWLIIKNNNELIMKEISNKYSIKYLKIPDGEFKPEWYTDWYHTTEEGESLKAKFISDGLVKYKYIN